MKKLILCILFSTAMNCFAQLSESPQDTKASKETVNLYQNLFTIQKNGQYLFGHQDALAYGVKWKYVSGRSDFHDLTQDHPGLYGWEIGGIELGHNQNLDSVPFGKMKQFIQQGYEKGAAITISWHGANPLTGGSAWEVTPGTVAAILPGASKHLEFLSQLDKVAAFIADLKGSKGEAIPILFRPYHELTGGWFWWGAKTTSPEQYKQLFIMTYEYLVEKKGLHNLLFVYNTGGDFATKEAFLASYPGNKYVDIVSFDIYQPATEGKESNYSNQLSQHLSILEQIGKELHKPVAVAETGYNKIPINDWWTNSLARGLAGHQFAYVLLWRNAGFKPKENDMEFYIPYPGHNSATNFLQYIKQAEVLTTKKLKQFKLYSK